jgi:hypothetical protein
MLPRSAPASERRRWDTEGKYVDDGWLVAYTTTKRRLLKVGQKMRLRDVYRAAAGVEDDVKYGA